MSAAQLRYPNAQIEDETDFLEIKVVKYEPPGFKGDQFAQQTSSQSLAKNARIQHLRCPLTSAALKAGDKKSSNAANFFGYKILGKRSPNSTMSLSIKSDS